MVKVGKKSGIISSFAYPVVQHLLLMVCLHCPRAIHYMFYFVKCNVGIDRWFALCKVVTPPDSGKVCSWNSLTDDFTSMFSWTQNFEKCFVDLQLSTSNYEDIKPADIEVRNVTMYTV